MYDKFGPPPKPLIPPHRSPDCSNLFIVQWIVGTNCHPFSYEVSMNYQISQTPVVLHQSPIAVDCRSSRQRKPFDIETKLV